MKNQTDLSRVELRNQEAQTQSAGQLPHKDGVSVRRVSSQAKLTQCHALPTVRVYRIIRLADNTLFCTDLGGTLPLNRRGNLDKAKLADEIASRKRLYPLQ